MSEIELAKYLFGSLPRLKFKKMSSIINDPPYQKPTEIQRNSASIPDEFLCKLCNRQQIDPRVLPCFHSFCFSCLQDWLDEHVLIKSTTRLDSIGNIKCETDGGIVSSARSEVSGYESDVAGDSGWRRRKSVQCPICHVVSKLPPGGVTALPPHYILQHRMLLASLNQEAVCFFCDLCSTDIPAVVRCGDCLLNLCLFCSEVHKRQLDSAGHEMVTLLEAGAGRQSGVTAVRRQLMCSTHPEKELSMFCSKCELVVCRECCILLHRNHPCDIAHRAAQSYCMQVRQKIEKAKLVQKETKISLDKLDVLRQRVELRCEKVEEEIESFIQSYIKALEDHSKQLLYAVAEARQTKLKVILHQRDELTKSVAGVEQALKFGDDLINEGSDTEVLSFAPLLVSKFDESYKKSKISLPDLKVLETINFLPEERSGVILNKQMFGVVTTQRVSSEQSTLEPEGLEVLNNARQQQTCEVVLVTRDSDGHPMCHGGDRVCADLRYRDLTRRCIPVSVIDRQDGTYLISFIPDSAGNMALSLTVAGSTVKGSPFPVCVRTLRAHHGTFHCCSFCSGGGRKDLTCGCGASMPGGYKGCGHGHLGHPGRRHWSCCGNTLHNSECGRPPPTLYHFSL